MMTAFSRTIGYIRENFLLFIILLFLGAIFLRGCWSDRYRDSETVTIKRDTTYVIKSDTLHSKPVLIETKILPMQHWDTTFIVDTTYSGLKKQYIYTANKYLATNYYRDSFLLDSVGKVFITDTIQRNMIQGRGISYNIKYPTITNTVTITKTESYKPRNIFYVGGRLAGNQYELLNSVSTGLFLKNKRDVVMGVDVGVVSGKNINFGVTFLQPLSRRKR